jgi:hypothetical protein
VGLISADGRCEAEIRAKVAMVKYEFSKRKKLLTQKMIVNRIVKRKTVKTVVWSVALYGADRWTLRKKK